MSLKENDHRNMNAVKLFNPSSRSGRVILLSIIVLLFVVCIKTMTIDYEDNDDYVYSRIMSGSYSGTPSAMTVYEGYIFGLFVSWLYRIVPNIVEWYILVFHALYILSYIVIANKLLTSKISNNSKCIAIVSLSCAQLYLLISPQFTILAGELALAACVAIIGRPRAKDYIAFVICVFLSSQIRIQSLLMVIAPMMPLLFLPIKYREKSYWIKPIVVFASIVLVFGVNIVSNRVYYENDDWKYYIEYNKPRGIIEQSLCKYNAVDILKDPILKVEYSNLCNSRLIDGKILSIEDMNECAEYVQSMPFSFFKMNILPYFDLFNQHGGCFMVVWFIGLFIYAIRKKDWKSIWVIVFTGVLFLIELCYCMTTSFAKERLVICMMMYLFVVGSVCTYRLLKDRSFTVCALLLSIVFGSIYIVKSYAWEHKINLQLKSIEKINKIVADVPYDKVFIIGMPIHAEAYKVSTTPITNKQICKGWLNNIPLHKEYYSGYESLLDRVPIVISHKAENNISDIEFILKHNGIEVDKDYLYRDDECAVILLRKLNNK